MEKNQEYDNLNQIGIDTYYNLYVTCCNIAVGFILQCALDEKSIDKFPDEFNLRIVKNSMNGHFVSKEHKHLAIAFLKYYISTYKEDLSRVAKYYYSEYKRLAKAEHELVFLTIAASHNTNIYPEELGLNFDSIKGSYNKIIKRGPEDDRYSKEMEWIIGHVFFNEHSGEAMTLDEAKAMTEKLEEYKENNKEEIAEAKANIHNIQGFESFNYRTQLKCLKLKVEKLKEENKQKKLSSR